MNSSIYSGTVYHRRFGAREHTLHYRVFYFLLDLDELESLDSVSRWFGVNRRACFTFRDDDHGARHGRLRDWCVETLRGAGIDGVEASFQVLTTPRVFGYVFNPITIIYCRKADGTVGAMIYEVNNTFGERIAYVIPVSRGDGPIRQRCDKSMFVSPFYELAGHYAFDVSRPGESVDVGIDYYADDERQLRAVFRGRRCAFESRQLARLALQFPAVSLKIMAGIHYEALKLWLKGVPLVRHRKSDTKLSIGTEL